MDDDTVGSSGSMTAGDGARAIATVILALAGLVVGPVALASAAPPSLTIEQPLADSATNDQLPELSGSSEDVLNPVTVRIYAGASAAGSAVETLTTTLPPLLGAWLVAVAAPLEPGQYTAVAEQEAEGVISEAVTFTVDTTAPAVSIDQAAPSTNDPTPTLGGKTSTEARDDSTVSVTIYDGASVGGEVASSGEATVNGSSWSYAPTHLADGVYTARATQRDEAGNTGASLTTTFTVDTLAPAVTIATPAEGAVLNLSRTTLSGLAGHASGDHPTVRLKIYTGHLASGSPAETLEILPSAGKWTTGSSDPILANGIYTVLAEQSDAAGNLGASTVTFTITTSSPSVTLDTSGFTHRASALLTTATPSFTGSASTEPEDSQTVIVNIFSGASTSGSPVRTVEGALSGTAWQAGPVTALADGTYTALAEQAYSNPFGQPGVSASTAFTVDGHAPVVTLTSPADGSSTSSPSVPLGGAAGTDEGDSTTVTIQLYAGTTTSGPSPLETISVQATGATWSAAIGGLSPGTYTARASQRDDVGNVGHSAPATFTVTKPEPPPVTTPSSPPPVTNNPPTTPVSAPIVSEPTLMQPFPVVRIAGSVTSSGVKLNLLTVQTPAGTIVSVSCHGHGCPAKRVDTVSTAVHSKGTLGLVTITFRRFERSLRAGVSLQIRISKPGQIGKYTRFTVRRGKLPARLDTCLRPDGVKPMACPS